MKITKQVTLDEYFIRKFKENKNINASQLINGLLTNHFEAQNPQKDLKIDEKVKEMIHNVRKMRHNMKILKQEKAKDEKIETYELPEEFIKWIKRRKNRPSFFEVSIMKRQHNIPMIYEGSKIIKLWDFLHEGEEEVKNDS